MTVRSILLMIYWLVSSPLLSNAQYTTGYGKDKRVMLHVKDMEVTKVLELIKDQTQVS
jgi:hypothetical protein